MRVLHCIDTLQGGGAERQLCYLAEALVALGHEVDVAFMLDGVHAARLDRSGARMHRLGWRAPHDPSLLIDLCRIIRARQPDVVHTWLRRMDLVGGLAGRLTGRPWIYGERSRRRPTGELRERLRQWWGGHAAAVVANSAAGARSWRQARGRDDGVFLVPNGLPIDEIAATAPAAPEGVAADTPLVLFAGRFDANKNVPLLATAVAALLRAEPRVVALACGQGPLHAWFRAEMARQGLGDRARAPGWVAEIWPLMKRADLFFSPSRVEGNPNAVLEAMACGCPLVLSDIPEHRELADAGSALFFDPRAPDEAVARLREALADRPAAARRARAAAERVRTRSVERMARAYADIYARLARTSATTRAA